MTLPKGEALRRKRARKSAWQKANRPADVEIPNNCPLLGVELVSEGGKGYRPNAASIDRIDNKKGYEPGNVWVISKLANTMKNSATIAELVHFSKKVVELFG